MEFMIAIILVDYHGYTDTKECVESIIKSSYSNYRIIIVNNTSSSNYDGKKDMLLLENADIVDSGSNLGFSGGNNVGIRYAKEKYNPDFYLLLNNDTVVSDNLLEKLLEGYYSDNGIGLVSGKITMFPETSKIWYGGGDYFEKICSTKMRGYAKIDDGKYDKPEFVGFAPGCLFFFPSCLLETVGYMSEEFFLYCEDTDYVFRIRNSGLKVLYWPNAIIAHKESVSTGKGSPTHQYYLTRNKLIIISRYSKNVHIKIRAHIRYAYIVWKDVARGRRNFKCTFDAYWDFIRGKTGKNRKYSND